MLLCLNRLVKPVAITTSFQNTAGKFINNLNLSVTDKIINIIMVKNMGSYSLGKIMHIFKIFLVNNFCVRRNKIVLVKNLVNMGDSLVCKRNTFCLLINLVVALYKLSLLRLHINFIRIIIGFRVFFNLGKLVNIFVNFVVFISVILALTGNNKRGSSLINKNRVNFINYAEVKTALNFSFQLNLHIVTQIVKTKLIVCAVSNIAVVRKFSGVIVHIRKN